MTNAKDTFYLMLRDRLAALNPARTVVVRGITRPGSLVEENELVPAESLADVFRLRWTALKMDASGPLPLGTMACTIEYATAGTPGNGGLDRGRMLAAMDAELSSALSATPQNVLKRGYGSGPAVLTTNVFWGDAVFGPVEAAQELVRRSATVEVFSYREGGE